LRSGANFGDEKRDTGRGGAGPVEPTYSRRLSGLLFYFIFWEENATFRTISLYFFFFFGCGEQLGEQFEELKDVDPPGLRNLVSMCCGNLHSSF
jgi:hypothetical protein